MSRQAPEREVVQVSWMGGKTPNRMQVVFAGYEPQIRERYYLGTPGCGKTTGTIWDVNRYAMEMPGSTWLLARYTSLESESVLKGDFERETPREILGRWDADESRQYYRNGSSVYIHGLKPAEGQGRHSKYAGYNLSGVALSQVESIPQDVVEKLLERLRHPQGPRYLLAEGNIPDRGHWLYGLVSSGVMVGPRVWISGSRLIIIGNLKDNEKNLPPEFVENMKTKYPPNHPEYGPKVGGDFGISVIGEPVYGEAFREDRHVVAQEADYRLPLYESWDFGLARPAVLWSQALAGGRLAVLGEYMGDGTLLQEAAMEVRRLRKLWFPQCRQVWVTGDPAGEMQKDTGKSSAQTLRDLGVPIATRKGANSWAARGWAIQEIAKLMGTRVPKRGEAFMVHPRCDVYMRGLKGGYIKNPNHPQQMPVKDGYYDHLQNCFDADTDVLTESGWRRFADLSGTEQLATVHLPTDRLEYQHPSRLIRRDYSGPMVALGGHKLSGLVTPDHRMIVYARGNGTPSVRVAGDLRIWDRIKLNATWQGQTPEVILVPGAGAACEKEIDPHLFAEFLGWYVAEGSVSQRVKIPGWGYRVHLSQNPGWKRDLLRLLLNQLPWHWVETPRGFVASSKQLWTLLAPLGTKYDKYIPPWVKATSPEVIRRFLTGACLGDGFTCVNGSRMYATVSRRLADDMQELFLKVGRAASVRVRPAKPYHIKDRRGSNTVQQYHVLEWLRPHGYLRDATNRPNFTEHQYDGQVYCATVPNGTLIVRHNGKPMVAGNCAEYTMIHFWAGDLPRADETGAIPVRELLGVRDPGEPRERPQKWSQTGF